MRNRLGELFESIAALRLMLALAFLFAAGVSGNAEISVAPVSITLEKPP